jgi:ABC-type glycerol-3-phosphate transport system substrate-binding protein
VPADGIKIVPFLTAESSPESVQKLTELIGVFEEANPDIRIELQLTSADAKASRIISNMAVGAELGIFDVDRARAAEFINAGFLLPLNSIVDDVGVENFIPGSLLYWPWDNNLYLFPADLSAETLHWRTDLFEAAGLPEPDTYERILEASERLNGQDGVAGNGWNSSNNSSPNRFSAFLWQNCGDYFDKSGEVALDRPGSLQAVKDYAELNKYAPEGSESWGAIDPLNAYVAGRIAMTNFTGRLGYSLGTNAPDIAAVTAIREARVSRGGQGPLAVYGAVTAYAIGSTVKYPDEAKKFLQFLLTGENLLQYAMGVPGHLAPSIKAIQDQVLEQDNPYVKEHRDWIELTFKATTYFNEQTQNMGSITEDCKFEKSLVPMPWSSRLFGSPPAIATMLQKIALENQPIEQAHADAVATFQREMESWKAENDWFTPISE